MAMDPFKLQYKKYKRRKPPPDLSEVFDFSEPDRFPEKIEKFDFYVDEKFHQEEYVLTRFGLKPLKEWNVYRMKESPGFIFISNPFHNGYQRYWVKRCLKDFPKRPNMRNLDLYMQLSEEDDIWESGDKKRDPSSDPSEEPDLLSKLRWVTLGYHYNWSKKKYYGSDTQSKFPDDLQLLTNCIAKVLGFKQYHAEAGIVNYYNMSSTLGGHVDEAEFDMTAPLLSFSFGQTALYLQGGRTRSVKPEAVFLKSGDIMIMSGDTRWCYHAVPRILPPGKSKPLPDGFSMSPLHNKDCDVCINVAPQSSEEMVTAVADGTCDSETTEVNSLQSQTKCTERTLETNHIDLHTKCNLSTFSDVFDQFDKDMKFLSQEDNWKPFAEYLHGTRINFNVRQVVKAGDIFPSKGADLME
ncbi:nucleic acid dioxygenase ALKBH1-like [Glandiceps talaboti]